MKTNRRTVAVPPGFTIREQLEDRGLRQKEFALRMDLSEKHVSHLINGEVRLTPDVASRLEMVLGVPARFWLDLEADYRERLNRVEEETAFDADAEIAARMPYAAMARLKWIEPTRDAATKVTRLRRYFEVARLTALASLTNIACRRLGVTEKADCALLAWAQRARLCARECEVGDIDMGGVRRFAAAVRGLTLAPMASVRERLEQGLALCGVAVVFLPHLPGSFLQGAAFYDGARIVLGLTNRGKDVDRFWFTLCHELGHVVLGHLQSRAAMGADGQRAEEAAADAFAENALVPDAEYRQFAAAGAFSAAAVRGFASRVGVAPGVVVGRLQKDRHLPHSALNHLKPQYAFA